MTKERNRRDLPGGQRPPQTCTFVVIPAEDLHLVLVADVENLICVFCDGHVGGA